MGWERVERVGAFTHQLNEALGHLMGRLNTALRPEGPQLESHHFHCFQIKI